MAEEQQEQETAKFNMALDTLKRLSNTLHEIKQLSYKIEYPLYVVQQVKINLVKQFFIQASPLLKPDDVNKYQKEVLGLSPTLKTLRAPPKKCFMANGGRTLITNVYDCILENRLNEILIELQSLLQDQGMFMPPAEDEGAF